MPDDGLPDGGPPDGNPPFGGDSDDVPAIPPEFADLVRLETQRESGEDERVR